VGGGGAGGRVDEVVDAARDGHLRLDRAQDRRPAGREGGVGQLHQCVALLLGAGAQVIFGAVGLRERGDLGQHAVHLGDVDVLLGGGRDVPGLGDRGDHRHLLGGDRALGAGGGEGR
jgi:hypothetical protein